MSGKKKKGVTKSKPSPQVEKEVLKRVVEITRAMHKITYTHREPKDGSFYPTDQVDFEKERNRMNNLLRRSGILVGDHVTFYNEHGRPTVINAEI